jgi:hypothetical protein
MDSLLIARLEKSHSASTLSMGSRLRGNDV